MVTQGPSLVTLEVKNLLANAGNIKDSGSIPDLGRSPGGGHGNPFQYSFFFFYSSILAWRIPWTEEPGIVYRVSKSRT